MCYMSCVMCHFFSSLSFSFYNRVELVGGGFVINGALVFETCMKLGNLQCKFYFNRNELLLLMIEKIKIYQINKFFQGDIKCTKKLPELLFLYPFTTCVPCVPQSSRKILSIINTDTSQMSPYAMCHVSCVTCQMTHVTSHMSYVTSFFLTKGES